MSERVNYGRLKDVIDIPDLIELQTKSYADFLQLDKHPDQRENQGLQEIFKDISPIADFSGNLELFFGSSNPGILTPGCILI